MKRTFDARMKEAEESLVSNGEVKNALDLCDKNGEKKLKNFKRLIQVMSLVKVILKMMV